MTHLSKSARRSRRAIGDKCVILSECSESKDLL
jgi:hypothetical protein